MGSRTSALDGCMQVPAHDGLRYLNVHVVDDVVKLDGVTVKDLPISHNKSPDRWRKVMSGPAFTILTTPPQPAHACPKAHAHAAPCLHACAGALWRAAQRPNELLLAAQMDLPLLLKEHQSNPADTRTVFYLAQTYELIEDTETALAMYQRRIRMGGWQQEVFESHFRRVSARETHSPSTVWCSFQTVARHRVCRSLRHMPCLACHPLKKQTDHDEP